MESRFYYDLHRVLAVLFLLLCMSCNNGNKPIELKRCMKLAREVELFESRLPIQIDEGIMLVKVEYVDSVYTTWMEVDDKAISFDEIKQLCKKRKKEIISDVTVSDGNDKSNYEMYVEYSISMRMIYFGKNSHQQTEFTITPSEIDEALNSKADAYSKLQMLLSCAKPQTIEGMGVPILMLQDSIVYMTIELDENKYDIKALKETASPFDIMADLRGSNPKLIRYMAEAHCGLTYHIIGLRSQKGFDMYFTSNEILANKLLIDADVKTASEIVESDE